MSNSFAHSDPLPWLGGLSAATFLSTYWQKKPLLIRQAFPAFGGLIDADSLAALACDERFHPRLVVEQKNSAARRFELYEGPFDELVPAALPDTGCTFLVPGIERALPEAWALLHKFSFIPWARVDDLMVSWSRPGGTVGPHVDAYDVFLLQGPGRRRWEISRQTELEFLPDQPIDVIANFTASESWVMEPGDMLYVPPGVAHSGVALDEGFTYSIGFLAPTAEALVHNFLGFLGQSVEVDGIYQDPALSPAGHPGALPAGMVEYAQQVLSKLCWDRGIVEQFLGRLLTGPKPGMHPTPPEPPVSSDAFWARLQEEGELRLADETRALMTDAHLMMNGEAFPCSSQVLMKLRPLTDQRVLSLPVELSQGEVALLYDWYVRGFVCLPAAPKREV